MSIFDAKFEIIDDADLYADGTTAYAGTFKELDWVESGLEMGQGTPIYLCIRVGTTVFSGGTTADFKLIADDTSDSHDGNSTVILTTGAIATANLDAVGDWIFRGVVPINVDTERYLSMAVTCVGTYTQGKINAWLANSYQSSFNVQVSESNI